MKSLRPAFTLILATLGIHTGPALATRWTEARVGLPFTVPGVRAVVVDRAGGSTLYAQTSDGGLFKSTDSAANWNALVNLAGVQVLALDPTTASTVYAGTARGVFKTTDGGQNWASAGLAGTSVSVLAVDPLTPSTLYAAGFGDNIYKSADAGATWNPHALGLSPTPGSAVSSILLDQLTPSTLYASAAHGPQTAIYKSTDAGISWAPITPRLFARLLAIDPIAPSTLYALPFGSGLSKSTDGGATFTPTGFTKNVLAFAVDPGNSNILYASTYAQQTPGTFPSGQVIYKSLDGGNTWNTVNTSVPPVASLVVSPVDSSSIYAATFTGGVFKSTDAGTTWNAANTGLRVLPIKVLQADPVDPATIYAGANDGLFKTVDSGGSWSQLASFQLTCCTFPPGYFPPGLPPPPSAIPPFAPVEPAKLDSLLIDFTNPGVLYLATQRPDGCFFADVLLFKSTDGGASWSDSITPKQSGCGASGLMGMDPTDPNTLYLRYGDSFDGFGMLKTTDGGDHWNSTGLGADIESVLVIDPTNPATLYAGTSSGVQRSTNGAARWDVIGLANANVNLLAIDPVQPNILYAGTAGVYPDAPGLRSLFKSTDNGGTWSPINDGLGDVLNTQASANALILDPAHTNVLYLATSGYGVFKTSNGGLTWAPFNDDLTHLDVRLLAIARGTPTTVYAGTPVGVFKITEEGN